MLGIEKLLEKLLYRSKLPKEKREEIDINVNTKYIHGLLFYNTYFDFVAKALGKDTVCLIVGGWIRDRLLNRSIKKNIDVDFLVSTNPIHIVKKLKSILGKGDIFQFEKGKTVATIIFYENQLRYRFDFSYLDINEIINNPRIDFYEKEEAIIKKIEEDLLQRDFTINAMAVIFDDVLGLGASQTVLFDPSCGLEDLQKGLLKPVSYENIKKDPVRILRGYRIANQLKFEIDKDFKNWVRENKDLIINSPIERIRDELLKIFDSENAHYVISELIKDKLFQKIVPYIDEMVSLGKTGEFHKYPLIQHSLKTLEYMESFLKKKS